VVLIIFVSPTLNHAFNRAHWLPAHASLCHAQNRSRSGDILCAIRRNFGRCDGIDYLLQHRAGDYARCDAVVRLASSGIAEVNDLIEETLKLANPGNVSRDLARAETYQE
jgi:hypothetical protein